MMRTARVNTFSRDEDIFFSISLHLPGGEQAEQESDEHGRGYQPHRTRKLHSRRFKGLCEDVQSAEEQERENIRDDRFQHLPSLYGVYEVLPLPLVRLHFQIRFVLRERLTRPFEVGIEYHLFDDEQHDEHEQYPRERDLERGRFFAPGRIVYDYERERHDEHEEYFQHGERDLLFVHKITAFTDAIRKTKRCLRDLPQPPYPLSPVS